MRINLQIEDVQEDHPRFICTIERSIFGDSYGAHIDADFFNDIPEKRILSDLRNGYSIAATDTSVEQLLKLQRMGVPVLCEDEATRIVFDSIHLRMLISEKSRENYAKFKLAKEVPQHNLQINAENPLADYQQVGAVNASINEGFGLFMEQGTGKTAVAIADACNYPHRADGTPTRVLVLCPNNVRMNWQKEFQKFATVPVKVSVVRGTQVKRINQLAYALNNEGQQITVVVMSYDTMVQSWEAVSLIPWDICYIDEGHYIKDERTRRWKFCKRLRERCIRRRVLTGTPIANSLMDTYTLFEFMGAGMSGFSTFKEFKKYYGVFDSSKEKGFEALVAVQNIPAMKDRLSRYTYSITKKEALPDLPEKVYDIVEVEMSSEQRDAYNQLATDLAYEIESDLDEAENTAMTINNVLTKLLKLAQVTSGFLNIPPTFDDVGEIIVPKKTIHFAPNPKIQAVLDIAADKGKHEKTIVWSCFVEDILKLERALQMIGENPVTYYGATSDDAREEAEYRFNNDDSCKWLIGNPAAGGTGLNLLGYPVGKPEQARTCCNHHIYFAKNWSSLQRSQSSDRSHRRGTLQQVRITDLCVPDTIDEMIHERVTDKIKAAIVLSDVREILSSILKVKR